MRRCLVGVLVIALGAACSSGGGTTRRAEPARSSGARHVLPVAYLGYHSDVYAAAEHWLCRPDLASDQCRENLDTTIVRSDGSTEVVRHHVVRDAGVDCFYIYPTVNFGEPGNASRDGQPTTIELTTVHAQAGPFSAVCRVFAPRYRQVTLSSFASPRAAEYGAIAYGDVVDAFKHYMANDNGGRGVVLIGHSQGAGMLLELVKNEIDHNDAMRARLVSALLIGGGVTVPPGADVGGDLARVPACRKPAQVGCVIAYSSFRATSPPPPSSFFGRPRRGNDVVLCTNPAALAGGAADLDSRYPSTARVFAPGAAAHPITTGQVSLPGLLSAECVVKNGFSYLEVTVHGDPNDPRVDDISGDLTPEWGLHVVDMNLAMGDLVELVGRERDAWLAAR